MTSIATGHVEVDGLRIGYRRAGSGPPVVLLHGFTGAASTWDGLIEVLAPEYDAIALDIVGHGRSDAPPEVDRYAMRRTAADLVAAAGALGAPRAAWLGYSMGGRTALQIAVHHPDAVAALMLEGASPGLETEAERRARIEADEALAGRIERDGIEAFVSEWEALPLWESQRTLPASVLAAQRQQRLTNRPAGLANSLRGAGTGAQEAVHDRLGEARVPVLLIAGTLDVKYTEIAHEMARALPTATMQPIDGAGHTAHLEQPEAFAGAVTGFLRRAYAAPGERVMEGR